MKNALAAVIVLAIIGGAVWLGIARFAECRRVHPLWYCLTSDGK